MSDEEYMKRREELDSLRRRDLEWMVEAKRLSTSSISAITESSTLMSESMMHENSVMDIAETMKGIMDEMTSLRKAKRVLEEEEIESMQRVNQLEDRIHDLSAQKEKLEAENSKLSSDLVKLVPELKSLQSEHQQLLQDFQRVENERDQFAVEKNVLIDEKEKALEAQSRLEEAVNGLQKDCADLRRICESHVHDREELIKEKEKLSAEIDGLKEISQEALVCVENLISEMEKRKERNMMLEKTIEERALQSTEQLEKMKEQLAMDERELEEKQKRVVALKSQIEMMTGSLASVKKEKEDLEELHRSCLIEMEELKKASEENMKVIDDLK